jgi:AGCS family alanine or glycine:cation symporter
MVMCGAVMSLDLAWSFADVTMGLMTICNLIAIVLLSRQALWLLRDYTAKKRKGITSPTFRKEEMPEEMRRDIECWE